MKNKFLHIFLYVCCLVSVFIVAKRINIENKYKEVEFVLGYDDMVNLCKISGQNIEDVAIKIKGVGVTSIAINEDTLKSLSEEGKVIFLSAGQIQSESKIFEMKKYIQNIDMTSPFYTFCVFKDNSMISNGSLHYYGVENDRLSGSKKLKK